MNNNNNHNSIKNKNSKNNININLNDNNSNKRKTIQKVRIKSTIDFNKNYYWMHKNIKNNK